MPPQAPANLVQLLGRLRLGTPAQISTVGRRAVRLAGDLPDFESVWVDALAQERMLTPWQAAEINAGRGDGLLHGPFRVSDRIAGPHFAQCFAATHLDSGRTVRLYYVRRAQRPLAEVLERLGELQERTTPLIDCGREIEDFGTTDGAVWIACRAVDGQAIRDWMTEHGRLPPQAVLHIAREIAARLWAFEQHGVVHGDLNTAELFIEPSGGIALPAVGLRGIVRPQEGYSFSELLPEAYDYLAPERISAGTPPNISSDLYACGSLWWHLLAGRPPFPGGNAIAKLKAVHAARAVDIRPFCPTVSSELAGIIGDCMQRDPERRPKSFAEVVERLGEPTLAGKMLLASLFRGSGGSWQALQGKSTRRRRAAKRKRATLTAAAAVCMLVSLILGQWAWRTARNFAFKDVAESNSAKQLAPPKPETQLQAAEARSESEPAALERRRDPMLKRASAVAPLAEQVVEDIVLPTGAVLRVEQLDLKPHVRVRGRGGKRPQLSVPRRGLVIGFDDVRFDGIDFVWEAGPSELADADNSGLSMLDLQSQTVTFRGCSFSNRAANPPVAIRFSGSGETLPGLGGELVLTDCVFDGLAAVIDDKAAGGLSIQLRNCLCVAAGPILRMARPPEPDEPVNLSLDHVTTRGDTAVLHCQYGRLAHDPGPITIMANGSALAGGGRAGLVIFSGSSHPQRLIRALTWSGQGSIVAPQTPVMVWHSTRNRIEPLPDEELEVAGLVRSSLEFAGRPDGPLEASRVVRWQVPLRSPEPPGADPAKLASPRDWERAQ